MKREIGVIDVEDDAHLIRWGSCARRKNALLLPPGYCTVRAL